MTCKVSHCFPLLPLTTRTVVPSKFSHHALKIPATPHNMLCCLTARHTTHLCCFSPLTPGTNDIHGSLYYALLLPLTLCTNVPPPPPPTPLPRQVWRFLERSQILSTEASQSTEAYAFESAAMRHKYYRHVSQGGWPFSTSYVRSHGITQHCDKVAQNHDKIREHHDNIVQHRDASGRIEHHTAP